jgi:UDP-GlcNAc:undecaprenyl-phosphate GlcNAc-1-phosphate transferase
MTLLVLLTALVISMALTPLMIRLAPRLRMVDLPDPRKVHAKAIPRVGGIGIVLGSLISLLLWLPTEPWLHSYLFGSLVLLAFGAADDSMELGHYPKFIGQIAAAVAVVYWGDVWVASIPFLSEALPPAIGKPFTVFALVGVMNAMNHSDGLDGLAGGESMLSMVATAYLAYLAGGTGVVVLAAAVIGGVFGFLRFNTHPAQVFMGDSGSQFIGFSVGVLAVLLTQQVNGSLSMALPVLIIGLPIVDILAVFGQRIQGGMNWFRATRNHIHHRLLDIGFKHHQVVVLIYSVQALLVLSAVLLAYESDLAVVAAYVLVCAAVFALIVAAERSGWRFRGAVPAVTPSPAVAADAADGGSRRAWQSLPMLFIKLTIPAYLLVAGLAVATVPFDIAIVAGCVLGLAAASSIPWASGIRLMLLRVALYLGTACQVFLARLADSTSAGSAIEGGYFILLGLAVAMALRIEGARGFRTTPLDFLMVFIVVVAAALSGLTFSAGLASAEVVVRLAVLFYAIELVISGNRGREGALSQWSVIAASLLLLGKNMALV